MGVVLAFVCVGVINRMDGRFTNGPHAYTACIV